MPVGGGGGGGGEGGKWKDVCTSVHLQSHKSVLL